jgi:rhamnosyltransferase
MMAIGAEYVLILNPFDLPEPKGNVMKSSKASLFYGDMEALFGSRAVIGNILDTLDEEAHIGLLVPPLPVYGAYFETLTDGYAGHFDELKSYAGRLGMTFPIIRGDDLPVYPYGGSFVARTAAFANAVSEITALTDAGESVPDDMVRLLLPYLMQKQLFMTGIACGSSYASTCATNLDFALRENNKVVFERFGPDFYWTELDKIRGKAP